jgi:hypothetical protein
MTIPPKNPKLREVAVALPWRASLAAQLVESGVLCLTA